MNELERAEEHLRVIRTLMERATIYRAISAPTALVGGLLATLASAGSLVWMHVHRTNDAEAAFPHFVPLWLLVLAIALGANTFFVWRAARKRGEPLISPSMRLALRALFPPGLAAALLSAFLLLDNNGRGPLLLSFCWTLFYGLALLATAHFAPRSLVFLGWAFLISAFAMLFSVCLSSCAKSQPEIVQASVLMGITFGFFHLVYAACTWPRRDHHAE